MWRQELAGQTGRLNCDYRGREETHVHYTTVTLAFRHFEDSPIFLTFRHVENSPIFLTFRHFENSPIFLTFRHFENSPIFLTFRHFENSPILLACRRDETHVHYTTVTLAFGHFENSPIFLAFRHFENSSIFLRTFQNCFTPTEPSRTLRSSSEKLLKVPRTNVKSAGNRFSHFQAAQIRNSLPTTVHNSPSFSSFKTNLKTHLL